MPVPNHLWKPPRIWEGSTAYIIGGGPSVNQTDLSLIEDKHVIGVNNSYRLGNWVDICWWGDMKWLLWHKKELLKSFSGLIVSCNTNSGIIKEHSSFVKFMGRGKPMGLETRKGFISWNRNSGCSAINLAYALGAKRAVLIGFDMSLSATGETHWHKGHSRSIPKHQKAPYARFRKTCTFIARDATRLKFQVLNASPTTTITAFPKVKLEEAI